MFITVYDSEDLKEYSQKAYNQGGIFFVDIAEDQQDISDILNQADDEGTDYPEWKKLALCLRKDWKLKKSWEVDKIVPKEEIERGFWRVFCRPNALRDIQKALELYALQIHKEEVFLANTNFNVFCVNREIFDTYKWCFDANDPSITDLMDSIVIGMVQNLIWSFPNEYQRGLKKTDLRLII